MSFTSQELRRYERHLSLPRMGRAGQEALRATSVLLVGAGGLGSPCALYLVAAGIGRLGLVDSDHVALSNLQRQILYSSQDEGRAKTEAAAERLRGLNHHVQLDLHPVHLSRENALDLVEAYDIVVDGSDNFATRYLINDACVLRNKPNVYGSIFQFEGQVTVFSEKNGPCYRCLYDRPPPPGLVPSCAEGGVLGVLPGLIGTLQATEVLKLATGIGESLSGRLLLVDTLGMDFKTIQIDRDPACPVCGEAPTITELIDYEAFCGGLQEVSSANLEPIPEVTPHELAAYLSSDAPPFLLDVRTGSEYERVNLGGCWIPLAELPARLAELEEHRNDEHFVVHCKSGARSAQAVRLLHEAGFRNASSLRGGLAAWVEQIDPSLPTP